MRIKFTQYRRFTTETFRQQAQKALCAGDMVRCKINGPPYMHGSTSHSNETRIAKWIPRANSVDDLTRPGGPEIIHSCNRIELNNKNK